MVVDRQIKIYIYIYCLESERVLKRVYDREYIVVGIYTGGEWADGGLVKQFLTVPCVFYAHAHTGFPVRTTLYATPRRDEGQVFYFTPEWAPTTDRVTDSVGGVPTECGDIRRKTNQPSALRLHHTRYVYYVHLYIKVCVKGGVHVYVIFIETCRWIRI